MTRERKWCKRCEQVRLFSVRVSSAGYKQVDCIACARRRGRERDPTWVTWQSMKQRCLNPRRPNYKYYGGLGVKVHQPWIDSFEQFLADVGPRPKGKTLDRKDATGDYVPGNVRWATAKEQIANRRKDGPPFVGPLTYKTKRKNYKQE